MITVYGTAKKPIAPAPKISAGTPRGRKYRASVPEFARVSGGSLPVAAAAFARAIATSG